MHLEAIKHYFCTRSTKIHKLSADLIRRNPLLLAKDYQSELELVLQKLQEKLRIQQEKKFYLYKTLKTHILPLTNVAFDKSGKRYSTCASIINYKVYKLYKMYLL